MKERTQPTKQFVRYMQCYYGYYYGLQQENFVKVFDICALMNTECIIALSNPLIIIVHNIRCIEGVKG